MSSNQFSENPYTSPPEIIKAELARPKESSTPFVIAVSIAAGLVAVVIFLLCLIAMLAKELGAFQ